MKVVLRIMILTYSCCVLAGNPLDAYAMLTGVQLPAQFGKTHFIVGFPHNEVKESSPAPKKKRKKETAYSVESQERAILFSPDDDLAGELIRLIGQDWAKIRVAIFTFTHDGIAQALLDAHKRGIRVEIVADPSYKSDRYSKVHLMQQEGVPVFEYDPEYIEDRRSNIMHHKFVVFQAADNELSLVWMGSFNFTKAADDRNQESAVKLQGAQACDSFTQQFERIVNQRCTHCKKKSQKIAKTTAKRNGKNKKNNNEVWSFA